MRDEDRILNGDGDPGNGLEAVPLAEGYGVELAVNRDGELVPVTVLERTELSVACAELPEEPIDVVGLAETEGPSVWSEDWSEEVSVPDNEPPVSPADAAEAVPLDRGNGAELDGAEYGAVDPDNPLPVDRGPTVSVKTDVVVAPADELIVRGGYGESVCVEAPRGTDVDDAGVTEPVEIFVVEMEAGYVAEVEELDGDGVKDSTLGTRLVDMPVPAELLDGAGMVVRFDSGHGTEVVSPGLALDAPGDVVVKDSKLDTELGGAPVPVVVPDEPTIEETFVKG